MFEINFVLQFEFLEAAAHGSSMMGIYVFATELLNAKNRAFGNVLISIGTSFGHLIFGITAMYIHDFRILLRIFDIPGIFVLLCYWHLPESVRWYAIIKIYLFL